MLKFKIPKLFFSPSEIYPFPIVIMHKSSWLLLQILSNFPKPDIMLDILECSLETETAFAVYDQ